MPSANYNSQLKLCSFILSLWLVRPYFLLHFLRYIRLKMKAQPASVWPFLHFFSYPCFLKVIPKVSKWTFCLVLQMLECIRTIYVFELWLGKLSFLPSVLQNISKERWSCVTNYVASRTKYLPVFMLFLNMC